MSGIAEHERQEHVLRMLDGQGRVSVNDLMDRFGVSAVTVRKDLESLERRRLLRRVRGGAVPHEGADEGAFEMRLRHSVAAKQSIARAAAAHVRDGDAISLDCSTTCYYLALELRGRRGLVVVTNGLRAADVLSESDSITVVVLGGTVRRSSQSLVGDFGDVFSSRGRLNVGFFGLRSLTPEHGLMELSIEETAVKRRLAAASDHVYGLFDSSKLGRFALHSFVATDHLTGLITDEGMPDDVAEQWASRGVKVERVTASGGGVA
ncbi:DeoR/GlpR transcriptional regulator [Micromonospora globispora]|uniref:DeoR/GlpR transcriptional regulator n=1 Tax=Micromonospora globispora TaxID=1450148 RepID=A0A317K766_9ACTN|nr:DeoR/GlpR family DNA-binding transcription regulator [Micromonospora globispora]PWU47692.1 DeoR/GlpR transcriptional regulator [Micromonospora globispora]PWU60988.1 DeoR/GlpR transcriptional regulator [Micromonospora globispora]RQW82840.1 DeoR/GlpR transcriptional regulator [Micromonospora globispora]